MAANDKNPPLITEPLSVALLDDEVFLDGDAHVAVSLTPDAAIETGIRLVNAGIGIEETAVPLPATKPR